MQSKTYCWVCTPMSESYSHGKDIGVRKIIT